MNHTKRAEPVVGKRFGRLLAVEESEKSGYIKCVCDCGKHTEVRDYALRSGNTRSCGCLKKDVVGKALSVVHTRNRMYGTNIGMIRKNAVHKNTTGGHPGIWYNSKTDRYEAYLNLHRRKIHLGKYHTYDEALKARLNGEDEYFAPILATVKADSAAM